MRIPPNYLTPSDRKYTAFEANGKLFKFTRIPFGVKNGVVEFQRKMFEFIAEENLMGAFSYLDNIVVASNNQVEHDRNLTSFLEPISQRFHFKQGMWKQSNF